VINPTSVYLFLTAATSRPERRRTLYSGLVADFNPEIKTTKLFVQTPHRRIQVPQWRCPPSRRVTSPKVPGKLIVHYGASRCGKTTLLNVSSRPGETGQRLQYQQRIDTSTERTRSRVLSYLSQADLPDRRAYRYQKLVLQTHDCASPTSLKNNPPACDGVRENLGLRSTKDLSRIGNPLEKTSSTGGQRSGSTLRSS